MESKECLGAEEQGLQSLLQQTEKKKKKKSDCYNFSNIDQKIRQLRNTQKHFSGLHRTDVGLSEFSDNDVMKLLSVQYNALNMKPPSSRTSNLKHIALYEQMKKNSKKSFSNLSTNQLQNLNEKYESRLNRNSESSFSKMSNGTVNNGNGRQKENTLPIEIEEQNSTQINNKNKNNKKINISNTALQEIQLSSAKYQLFLEEKKRGIENSFSNLLMKTGALIHKNEFKDANKELKDNKNANKDDKTLTDINIISKSSRKVSTAQNFRTINNAINNDGDHNNNKTINALVAAHVNRKKERGMNPYLTQTSLLNAGGAANINILNNAFLKKDGSLKPLIKRFNVEYSKANTMPGIDNSKKTDSMSVQSQSSKHILENYEVGQLIGKGSYAVVKLCTDMETGTRSAVKIYEKFRLNDPMKRKNVQREIVILKKLNHANCIKLERLIETPNSINLVMEYIGKTSLKQFLARQDHKRLNNEKAKRIFKQVADAVHHCHENNVVHRDIKLDNILLEEEFENVKLIDFGFSIIISPSKKLSIFCGTPNYMAPEIIKKREYSGVKVDCWALGILLYVMLHGSFPFKAQNEIELYKKIQKGQFDLQSDIVSHAKELIKNLLSINPDDRFDTNQILEHAWFK